MIKFNSVTKVYIETRSHVHTHIYTQTQVYLYKEESLTIQDK